MRLASAAATINMYRSSPLPPDLDLPIDALAAGFNDVTNSYKFHWFLAILAHLQQTEETVATVEQLIARMVADVWYPSNYFRLSFGKQDRLGLIASRMRLEHNLLVNTPKPAIITAALNVLSERPKLGQELQSLARFVPYRFLRPFFGAQLRGLADWKVNDEIRRCADWSFTEQDAPCFYRFIDKPALAIEIHPLWATYLQRNFTIVTGYCLWHLSNYLQRNNPNVPNIVGKIFPPEERNLSIGRRFWRLVLNSLGELHCVYSGAVVDKSSFSLDHFLPWSYVAHDLLWNLVPVPKDVNSAKGDQLPDLDRYFEPYARLQHAAVQVIAATHQEVLLEDHVMLFRMQSAEEVCALPYDVFKRLLQDTIAPQIQIARNMGFTAGWSYLRSPSLRATAG